MKRWLVILATMGALGAADITQDKLQQSQSDDANWLMYGKNYSGWRYSALRQINTATVKDLTPQWIFQTRNAGKSRKHSAGLRRNDVCDGSDQSRLRVWIWRPGGRSGITLSRCRRA